METIAKHRYARTSAQKARLVADLIRGKKVAQALEILTYTNKKAAALVKKVLAVKGAVVGRQGLKLAIDRVGKGARQDMRVVACQKRIPLRSP